MGSEMCIRDRNNNDIKVDELGFILVDLNKEGHKAVSYTHLTLPTIYSV